MKRKIFVLLAFLLVFTAGLILAQDPEPVEIDPALASTILLTGIGGLSVAAITEIVKRGLLKIIPNGGRILGYAASLVVSAGAVAMYLTGAGGFVLSKFIIYSLMVFGLANGFYKFTTKHNE